MDRNRKTYHWCAVPQCANTSTTTPEKLFIFISYNAEIRNKWLKLAGRRDAHKLAPNSPIFLCEDHFDLPNDMENYMEYRIMGRVKKIRMRPGCMPSKCLPTLTVTSATIKRQTNDLIQEVGFSTDILTNRKDSSFHRTDVKLECQEHGRKRSCDSIEQSSILKKQRMITITECQNEPVQSCTQSSSLKDTSQCSGSQTAGANVPEVLSEQEANEYYVQASPASRSRSTTLSPSPSQVDDDAAPFVTVEVDDADDYDAPVESNMCRVCLALDVKMYDLRDSELKIMFQNITGIMFNENNYSVLGSLCWECAARLKAAATFRSKALLSDSLLQDLITSGEQIRKHDITALKENVLPQGVISANTLTVTDAYHVVDIEDQNNTTQFLQSGDDGEQTSLSERFIVKKIKEEFPEMDFEENNIAIKTEIESNPTSLNTEEEFITKIKEERSEDITFLSEHNTVKSAYCNLLTNMGLTGERNLQENCESDINKTFERKSMITGIKEENSEMEIEDDSNVSMKIEFEDDPTFPDSEERNTEGENPLISSSSQDKINSADSSLLLNIGQCLLRSDPDTDTEKSVINTISKSDLISRTGPQRSTEPTNPTKKKTTDFLKKTQKIVK